MQNQLDAIVPCYNEAPRLKKVLIPLSKSKYIHRIIFVDDGSTDNSAVLAREVKKTKVIRLPENIGKGGAVQEGLRHLSSNKVLLLDADLIHLKPAHINQLVEKQMEDPNSMVLGVIHSESGLPNWDQLSGQRVLTTKALKETLQTYAAEGYGLEPALNSYFKDNQLPTTRVLLEGVDHHSKYHKDLRHLSKYLPFYKDLLHSNIYNFAKSLPQGLLDGFRSFMHPTVDVSHYERHPAFEKEIDGKVINYVKVGQGPSLILLHGLSSNWEGWVPLANYLRQDQTVYLLDLPGYGDSDELEKYSVNTTARYVKKLIDQLPSKPKAIIGGSMGGIIAARLVQLDPKIAEKTILIGPPVKDGNRKIVAKTLRYSLWAIDHFELSEAALKKIIETRLAAYALGSFNMYKLNRFLIDSYNRIGKQKMSKEAYVQMFISSADFDLKTALIKDFQQPNLIIQGREDRVTSPETIREKILPLNSVHSLAVIDKAGHIADFEQPKQVAKEIKNWLR